MEKTTSIEYFSPDLVKLNKYYSNQKELFDEVFHWLYDEGYVKESFHTALVEREEEFPTGLHTGVFDVAIPHTDPVHIEKPFIAVVRPNTPIRFREMGNLEGEVEAKLILFLGFTKSEEQLVLLQNFMSTFNDADSMKKIMETNSKSALIESISHKF